jgi:hypothetical protein
MLLVHGLAIDFLNLLLLCMYDTLSSSMSLAFQVRDQDKLKLSTVSQLEFFKTISMVLLIIHTGFQ